MSWGLPGVFISEGYGMIWNGIVLVIREMVLNKFQYNISSQLSLRRFSALVEGSLHPIALDAVNDRLNKGKNHEPLSEVCDSNVGGGVGCWSCLLCGSGLVIAGMLRRGADRTFVILNFGGWLLIGSTYIIWGLLLPPT